jgi:hypothetical protein
MNRETAMQVINEAMNIAIERGCFNLTHVTNIVKALDFLNNQPNVEFGEITED